MPSIFLLSLAESRCGGGVWVQTEEGGKEAVGFRNSDSALYSRRPHTTPHHKTEFLYPKR